MDLSNLRPAEGSVKARKRVGRGTGSGRGGTSTRGHKGDKARSGSKEKRHFEGGQTPMQRRLPKRGFNSLTNHRNVEVRLSEINLLPVDDIDLQVLKQSGLVPQLALSAKIVLSGEITRKVSLKGVGATSGAKAAIEAAGGSVAE